MYLPGGRTFILRAIPEKGVGLLQRFSLLRLSLPLRAARKQRRWSLAMAAEQIGVDLRTYARWEYGTQAPYPINLDRLCIVYGKTPEELGFAFLVVPE